MNKKIAAILSCIIAILLIVVTPVIIGVLHGYNVKGNYRVRYLRGLSVILYTVGAERFSYDLDLAAHKIYYDLHPVEVSFNSDLESRLMQSEAEYIEPDVRIWGMDSAHYSSGYGRHRFYVPKSKLIRFQNSLLAYKTEIDHKYLNGGKGFILEDVNMNRLLEWLAYMAKIDYYQNPDLNDLLYEVSGHMTDVADPMSEVQFFAKAYNLRIKIKNNTLYAWPDHQPEYQIESDKHQEAEQAAPSNR